MSEAKTPYERGLETAAKAADARVEHFRLLMEEIGSGPGGADMRKVASARMAEAEKIAEGIRALPRVEPGDPNAAGASPRFPNGVRVMYHVVEHFENEAPEHWGEELLDHPPEPGEVIDLHWLAPNSHMPGSDPAGKLRVTKVDDTWGGPTVHGVRIAE